MTSIVIARSISTWVQFLIHCALLAVATYTMAIMDQGESTESLLSLAGTVDLTASKVQQAVVAVLFPFVSWVVISRLEYRRKTISTLVCRGNRPAGFYLFVVYIISFSALREHYFSAAIDEERPLWTSGDTTLDGYVQTMGNLILVLGTIIGLTGFYHVNINTYYPEYFGFPQTKLVTAFPYSIMSHPMYIGTVLMHYGYAMRVLSPTALYLATVTAFGYWTVANIFEDPFMAVFYDKKGKGLGGTKMK